MYTAVYNLWSISLFSYFDAKSLSYISSMHGDHMSCGIDTNCLEAESNSLRFPVDDFSF